jgi:hypothetical protein
MSIKYNVEYTDTFGGEANYCWVKRAVVTMPDLTHYGYDGSTNWSKASKIFERELMRKAKKEMGLANIRGVKSNYGETIEFRPHRSCTVMFIDYKDE